ncbi:MAG TPA: hypothetical protein VMU34_23225 [Mycobacterium sp.]|nr:hypothetical protein [Mycobacterium sp.]
MTESEEPEIRSRANEFAPPLGKQEGGWYDELQHFFAQGGDRELQARVEGTVSPPSLEKVLENLVAESGQLTIPEQSRLVYGIGSFVHMLSPGQKLRRQLAEALVVAIPSGSLQNAQQLLDLLARDFTSRRSWRQVAKTAADNGWLNPDVAEVPLCNPSVVCINGKACLVVDTVFTSKQVTLENLKKVVSPLNWHIDYGHIFCDMKEIPGESGGWSRVLEKVGLCPDTVLRTPLKYYKTVEGTTQARVDYDLDPLIASEGDGKVTLDRGYINMRATGGDPTQPGVRVRTRKVVRIEGMSPETLVYFVCLLGYALVGIEMLFGPAKAPPGDCKAWGSAAPVTGVADYLHVPTAGATTTKTRPAATAVDLLNSCVTDLTDKSLELSHKWMQGTLTFSDLVHYSTFVGGRIASEPWRFLQAVSEAAASAQKTTPPTDTDQGDGT